MKCIESRDQGGGDKRIYLPVCRSTPLSKHRFLGHRQLFLINPFLLLSLSLSLSLPLSSSLSLALSLPPSYPLSLLSPSASPISVFLSLSLPPPPKKKNPQSIQGRYTMSRFFFCARSQYNTSIVYGSEAACLFSIGWLAVSLDLSIVTTWYAATFKEKK